MRVQRMVSVLVVVGFVSSVSWAAPFTAAYVHPQRLIERGIPVAEREAALIAHVERAHAMGIRILMPYTSNTAGAAHYPSEVLPERTYGAWDPIRVITGAARQRGMKVYPCVPVLASGHKEPRGILATHPEWAIRDTDGTPLGYISAGHPEARAFVVEALREVVERYDADGVLLDYLRYPNQVARLDELSESTFLLDNEGFEGWGERGDTPWQRYREAQLTTLMGEIHEALPGTPKAIYTWGPHVTAGHNVGQNWVDWVRNGWLDVVNVSGYCYPDNYGDRYMEAFRERLAGAKRLLDTAGNRAQATFCLGVVTSHGRIEKAGDLRNYLDAAREVGMTGVAVFTSNTLEEYYDAVLEADYLGAFEAAVGD